LRLDPDRPASDPRASHVTAHITPPGECGQVSIVNLTLTAADTIPIPTSSEVKTDECEALVELARLAFLTVLPRGPQVELRAVAELENVTWFEARDAFSMLKPAVSIPSPVCLGGAPVTVTATRSADVPPAHDELWFSPDRGRSWSRAPATPMADGFSWTPPSAGAIDAYLEVVTRADSGGAYLGSGFVGPFIVTPRDHHGAVPETSERFELRLAGANPGHEVRLELSLPERSRVEATVFDVGGAMVRRLSDREFEPGRYELGWDGAGPDSKRTRPGLYFIRTRAAGHDRVLRVVLLP
jgi:hypothetical protein